VKRTAEDLAVIFQPSASRTKHPQFLSIIRPLCGLIRRFSAKLHCDDQWSPPQKSIWNGEPQNIKEAEHQQND
jgi:hypothetical protein